MEKLDALLIYPPLGSFDAFLRDIPLSLIHAAADSVKRGFRVEILDLRLRPERWREDIDRHLEGGCRLVGLSVMTGHPILTALEVSRYVKERYGTRIVWGGPHPTILPEQTLECESIDFVIRDWGSLPLRQLLQHLRGEAVELRDILGLCYKKDGEIHAGPLQCSFEMLDFRDLPYHLVDISGQNYNRMGDGAVAFPIFTSMGCPYKCTFCMSPAVYAKIEGKKWIPYPVEEIIAHVEYLLARYDFQRLQVYDDVSFVDLERMRAFLQEYIRRGFHRKLKLDFRGVRINELDRMDDEYLALMVEAGVELMAIGVESGSDRVLKEIMNKGITVEQILRVNRKLARFPSLKPHYNFFCGVPGETLDDLMKTRDLLLQLCEDHPGCYLGVGADWKPLPGSRMTEDAVEHYGLELPRDLEGWIAIDSFDAEKIVHPWYTRRTNNMIKLLQIAGQLLDRKVEDYHRNVGPILGRLLLVGAVLYRPFLRFRVKRGFTAFLVEYWLRDLVLHNIGRRVQKAAGSRRRSARVPRA